MRILPTWLREFVNIAADDRQLAEDLTSAGIAVESVAEENGATIYEMDLTTNRVDAMNHYGVAREASAIYDVGLKPIELKLVASDPTLSANAGERMGRPALVGMRTADPATATRIGGAPPLRMTSDQFPIVIEDAQG